MKVQPVAHYARLGYPTHAVLKTHPELLRALPRRWRRHALIAAGVTACCSLWLAQATRAAADSAPHLAPIFQHGSGEPRGMYGTTFSSSPVFLGEDEARQVIAEELGKASIHLTPDQPTLTRLSLPALTMDGEDTERHLAIEYLTPEDNVALGFDKNRNLVESAKAVRQALEKAKTADTLAVFYDPCVPLTSGMGMGSVETPGMAFCNTFSGTTLAPLEFFRAVRWKDDTAELKGKAITLIMTGHTVKATVGSDQAEFDGKPATLPCPVSTIGETPYLPLRPVAEALGFKVTWSEKEELVVLTGRSELAYQSRISRPAKGDPTKAPTYAFLDSDYAGRQLLTREQAKAELRLQVADFLRWLKAEGMI